MGRQSQQRVSNTKQAFNAMATSLGCPPPFPNAERLPDDNGERFFSKYMTKVGRQQKYNEEDECLCHECTAATTRINKPTARQNHAVAQATTPTVPSVDNCYAAKETTVNAARKHAPPTTPMTIAVVAPTPGYSPQMWVPLQPVPMYYVAPQTCCQRYVQWTQHRRGRPPHDPHCHRRGNNNSAVNSSGAGAIWASENYFNV